MIEVKMTHSFNREELANFSKDELTELLKQALHDGVCGSIKQLIDNDELVLEAKVDRETGEVSFEASIVVFDKSDFESSIQCLATEMAEFGIDKENIVNALGCITTNFKGF